MLECTARQRRTLSGTLAWLLAGLLLATSQLAHARLPAHLPPDLAPWVDWVLADAPEHSCPFLYNGAARSCAWPSRLQLEVDTRGGSFRQAWRNYREGWLTLPGGKGRWPLQVTANGKVVAVTDHQGNPAVYLPAGRYQLAGRFVWDALPKSLPLPADVGLVSLSVRNKPVAFPVVDPATHALWIEKRDAGDAGQQLQDTVSVQRFRRLVDDLPMRVDTLLRLKVSGSQREVLIDHPLLADSIPLRVASPLPARLEPDGRLRVQVRPGEWNITVVGRFPAEVTRLGLPTDADQAEVWSFQAVNALRLVELSGPPPLDPRQTAMPAAWQQLPAYRMAPGAKLDFTVRRRGDPSPEPNQLRISREAWLDFSGQGYTFRDRISGTMTSGWRLEADPRLQLGRVALHGQPQLITQLTPDAGSGVEVRRGQINLESIARWQGPLRHIDAAGWQTDFSHAQMTLHMPPGWQLFSASGMDNVPSTWLQRWTLLDLFLVLITSLAVAKLWGWRWLPLALVTLALLWHAPGAPRYVWLNIVAAVALLRVIPKASSAYRLVDIYRLLSLLALVVIGLPFMVDQVRTAIYPQLARPYQAAMPVTGGYRGQASDAERPTPAPAEQARRKAQQAVEGVSSLAGSVAPPYKTEPQVKARSIVEFDPHALVQTGPGLPGWHWQQAQFRWNGPLQQGQMLQLTFLSPTINLVLNLLRVALLLALAARLVDRVKLRNWLPGQAVTPALALLAVCLFPPRPAHAEIPPQAMLDTLKQRLLEAPQCAPACAAIDQLALDARDDRLNLRLQVHAQAGVAIPLPGQAEHWLPSAVQLDGDSPLLNRDGHGVLWVLLQPGVHELSLSGALPQRSTVQIPLALRPARVTVSAHGWTVDGIGENGVPAAQLQLTRKQVAGGGETGAAALKPAELPPFVLVQRTLHLGLDWSVDTRVIRRSPTGTAALLRVPLLPGESVTTEGLQVVDGKVLVNLAAGARQTGWHSVLKQGDIHLQAAQQTDWVERWLLDVSTIWHVTADGIPVVHHTDAAHQWLPEWRPWPGEAVNLEVTRPTAVPGSTLTIESARLRLSPGLRASDAWLTLELEASQGGQHSLRLPDHARLETVTIDGESQPIRQQGREVTLPIEPGRHHVILKWRSSAAIRTLLRTPAVDLGLPASNLSLSLSLGADRWILLLGGPAMGPAILWWGVLVVVVIAALILHRLPFTPLRHYQWLLLGLGLTQSPLYVPLIVVGWLLALGLRGSQPMPHRWDRFNALQVLLVAWTLVALVLLFGAIQHGLLGRPDMYVMGNQSSATTLNWYQDRSAGPLPQAWVMSAPLLAYRLTMLAWALWLAFALLRWLRWGWHNFATDGLWRKREKASPEKAPAKAIPSATGQAGEDQDPWTS
jgi:hypothetical protein